MTVCIYKHPLSLGIGEWYSPQSSFSNLSPTSTLVDRRVFFRLLPLSVTTSLGQPFLLTYTVWAFKNFSALYPWTCTSWTEFVFQQRIQLPTPWPGHLIWMGPSKSKLTFVQAGHWFSWSGLMSAICCLSVRCLHERHSRQCLTILLASLLPPIMRAFAQLLENILSISAIKSVWPCVLIVKGLVCLSKSNHQYWKLSNAKDQ